VRITGGAWAKRRLTGPPSSSDIRPTPDALREQAFAVLAPWLPGAVFLDLFAGTGANSLEALSRGAATALLVEQSRAAAELIRRNVAAFAVPPERVRLVAEPAERAVARLAREGARAGVAWCDPPFPAWDDGPAALVLARSSGLLAPGARVVLEVPPRREVAIDGFEIVRELRGAVLLMVV